MPTVLLMRVAGGGTSSLLNSRVLVFRNEVPILRPGDFDIWNQAGARIALVREERVGIRPWIRPAQNVGTRFPRRCVVSDTAGTVVARLTRPRAWARLRFVVQDPAGVELARFVQRHSVAPFVFDVLQPEGVVVGRMEGDFWARHFDIFDPAGAQVALVRRTPPDPTSRDRTAEYTEELGPIDTPPLAWAAVFAPVGIWLMVDSNHILGI